MKLCIHVDATIFTIFWYKKNQHFCLIYLKITQKLSQKKKKKALMQVFKWRICRYHM